MSLANPHRSQWQGPVWKVVLATAYGLESPFYDYAWAPGRNVSSRTSCDMEPHETTHVNDGFHAFLHAGDGLLASLNMLPLKTGERRVLLLHGRGEDCVALGNWAYFRAAVFTELVNLGLYTGND